jgi:hypothetical protein
MIVEIVLDWWPRLGTPGRRSRGSATHQRRRAPTSAAGPSCCVRGGLDTYAHGYGPDTRVSTSGSAPACGGGKLRRGARVGVELSAALANESTVRMLGTGRAVDDRVGVNPTVTTTLRSDPPLVPSTSSSVQCTPGSGPATADVSSGATRRARTRHRPRRRCCTTSASAVQPWPRSPCRHGIGRSTRQVAGWSRTGRVLGGALPVFRAGALRTGVVDTLLATPREAGGLVDPPAVLCQRRLPWRPFTSCGGRGSLRVCFLATGCVRTGRDAGTARGLATARPGRAHKGGNGQTGSPQGPDRACGDPHTGVDQVDSDIDDLDIPSDGDRRTAVLIKQNGQLQAQLLLPRTLRPDRPAPFGRTGRPQDAGDGLDWLNVEVVSDQPRTHWSAHFDRPLDHGAFARACFPAGRTTRCSDWPSRIDVGGR